MKPTSKLILIVKRLLIFIAYFLLSSIISFYVFAFLFANPGQLLGEYFFELYGSDFFLFNAPRNFHFQEAGVDFEKDNILFNLTFFGGILINLTFVFTEVYFPHKLQKFISRIFHIIYGIFIGFWVFCIIYGIIGYPVY